MSLGQKVMAVACAMGLTVGAGMASRAMAQDRQIRTVAELNRAISADNLDRSVPRNHYKKTSIEDGKRVVHDLYLTKDGGRIATMTYNGNIFYIAVDDDRRAPFKYAAYNSDCNNDFETSLPTNFSVNPPNCIE